MKVRETLAAVHSDGRDRGDVAFGSVLVGGRARTWKVPSDNTEAPERAAGEVRLIDALDHIEALSRHNGSP